MAVPNPRTWLNPLVVTDTILNTEIRDALLFLLNPPRAKLGRTTSQSIANNSPTPVQLDLEVTDSGNGHSTITNNTRFAPSETGDYTAKVAIPWANSATGRRAVTFRVTLAGGGTVSYTGMSVTAGASSPITLAACRDIAMSVGDYLEVLVYQDSGGPLNIITTSDDGPRLDVKWTSNQ